MQELSTDTLFKLTSENSSSAEIKHNSSDSNIDIWDIIIGADLIFAIGAGILIWINILSQKVGLNFKEWALNILAILAPIGFLIISVMSFGLSPSGLLGVSVALFSIGIYSLLAALFFKTKLVFVENLLNSHIFSALTLVTLILLLFGILGNTFEAVEFFDSVWDLLGQITLFFGFLAFIAAMYVDYSVALSCRYNWQAPHLVFGLISIVIAVIFLLISISSLENKA